MLICFLFLTHLATAAIPAPISVTPKEQSLLAQGLRINRLLKCSRLISVFGAQIATLGRVRRLGVLCAVFLMIVHWVACVWWLIGTAASNASQRNANGSPIDPWIYRCERQLKPAA